MNTHTLSPTKSRVVLPLVGAAIFLLFYLSVSPMTGAVSTGELPLPGSAAGDVHEYLAANTTASVFTGVLQGISGLGLALVVASRSRMDSLATRPRTVGRIAGWVAVAAILASAVLSLVLGFIATTASTDLVAAIRDVSFYAGGVTHVVALGVLVLSVAVTRGWSRPVRIVCWIAGGLAVLSLLSVPIWVWLRDHRVCMVAARPSDEDPHEDAEFVRRHLNSLRGRRRRLGGASA